MVKCVSCKKVCDGVKGYWDYYEPANLWEFECVSCYDFLKEAREEIALKLKRNMEDTKLNESGLKFIFLDNGKVIKE